MVKAKKVFIILFLMILLILISGCTTNKYFPIISSSSGSGNVSVGGVNGSVQFNNNSQITGSVSFIYDDVKDNLLVGHLSSLEDTVTTSSCIGYGCFIGGGGSNNVMGASASCTGSNSIVIGSYAQAYPILSEYIEGDTIVGYSAYGANTLCTAIGYGAGCLGIASNALGSTSTANSDYSTAVGYGATTSETNEISLGNKLNIFDTETVSSQDFKVVGNVNITGNLSVKGLLVSPGVSVTENLSVGGKVGISKNITVKNSSGGNCFMNFTGGILYSTTCT